MIHKPSDPNDEPTYRRAGGSQLRAAMAGVVWLVVVGLVLPFALAFTTGLTGLGNSLFEYTLALLIGVACSCAGGAAFGRSLARLASLPEPRPLAVAGGLSFGPAAVVMGVILGLSEPAAVRETAVPIHVMFALMFVPAVFIVVAVMSLAFAAALRSRRLAAHLILKAASAAALAFLAADAIQHVLGRRVGGPNAAATATMITVTLVGCLAAAAATGAVMLTVLERHARRRGQPGEPRAPIAAGTTPRPGERED